MPESVLLIRRMSRNYRGDWILSLSRGDIRLSDGDGHSAGRRWRATPNMVISICVPRAGRPLIFWRSARRTPGPPMAVPRYDVLDGARPQSTTAR